MELTAQGFEYRPTTERPVDPTQVEMVASVLKRCQKTKTVNTRHSSYGLKHIFERSLKTYISNGAFITACINEGFLVKERPPNAYFNISEKSIKEIKLLTNKL